MDSVNFSRLLCTPTSEKKILNRTYTKSQTRNSFPEQKTLKQKKYFGDASNVLKNIGLTESTWETYQVNALYDFSYKKTKLYEYEEILAKNVKRAIFESDVDGYNSVEILIQIQKFPETAFTEKDNPALKITIASSDISEGSPKEYEEKFCGFLLSVGRKEGLNEKERLKEEAIILPLILTEYENKIFLQSFIDFLEENFSCIVSPLKFSSTELKWMLTLFSSPVVEGTTHSTVLEYEVPFDELKSIDYVIDGKSLCKVWNKIIKPGTQVLTEDKLNEFFSVLESHFYNLFHINLSRLQLRAIRTSLAAVRGDQTVVVYDSDKLYFVIRYLTHVAQEIAS